MVEGSDREDVEEVGLGALDGEAGQNEVFEFRGGGVVGASASGGGGRAIADVGSVVYAMLESRGAGRPNSSRGRREGVPWGAER